MKTWQSIFLGVTLGLLLSGIILLVSQAPRGQPLILQTRIPDNDITVYVTGAVRSPGLISLPRSSRVSDAVKAAGGFSEFANPDSLNLAANLSDGDKISIPFISSTSDSLFSSTMPSPQKVTNIPTSKATVSYPININLATATEIENLPGIGSTKAQDIVLYRQEHGSFRKIEDITNVPGIGKITFERIKGLITIGN